MPDITNPQIVLFSNERGRPMSDVAEDLYLTAKRFQQEWDALVTVVGSVPNTTDIVIDGSAVDGRLPVTGARLNGLKSLADAMVTWFETGSPTRIAQLQLVSVNGRARF